MFRCARKTGIVPDTTELVHIGFGTMNGKDGKPFKTRDGGVTVSYTHLDVYKRQIIMLAMTGGSVYTNFFFRRK